MGQATIPCEEAECYEPPLPLLGNPPAFTLSVQAYGLHRSLRLKPRSGLPLCGCAGGTTHTRVDGLSRRKAAGLPRKLQTEACNPPACLRRRQALFHAQRASASRLDNRSAVVSGVCAASLAAGLPQTPGQTRFLSRFAVVSANFRTFSPAVNTAGRQPAAGLLRRFFYSALGFNTPPQTLFARLLRARISSTHKNW